MKTYLTLILLVVYLPLFLFEHCYGFPLGEGTITDTKIA